ncbi:MAG: biotin synthase BioB, partial [Actinomycetota bacterium]
MTRALLGAAERALLDAQRDLGAEELAELASLPDASVPALAALAHEVRLERCGPAVEVEGILSAKTGGCPEDCHFCSQSSRFVESPVRPTAILDLDEILSAAKQTKDLGASEFCIVCAVRGPDRRLIERVLEATELVGRETGLKVAASLGILTREQARVLAEGGVHRYNHNLETARSFFTEIVTTHSWEERFETCEYVHEFGMELCCG